MDRVGRDHLVSVTTQQEHAQFTHDPRPSDLANLINQSGFNTKCLFVINNATVGVSILNDMESFFFMYIEKEHESLCLNELHHSPGPLCAIHWVTGYLYIDISSQHVSANN